MRTILVTGGAGFIGSNLVRYIFDKYPDYRILVLDALTYAGNMDNIPKKVKESERFEFWYGSVTNDDFVSTLVSRSDAVVHLAAESHVARSIYDNKVFYVTDVLGTQAVANAVVKHKERVERFIHVSTSEVYGTALTKPMTEEHPLNPMSPYASAKAGADRLVYSYWTTYDIPAVIVRPFNNYGPYQHLEKVIPRFITSALCDEPLTVHGKGEARRDWLYVDDHCKALDRCLHVSLDRVRGEVINIASGFDLDILSIARLILKITGKDESLITFIEDRPGQVQHHIASTEKSKNLLDWQVSMPFEEGLRRTIQWYTENEEWWRRIQWMRLVPIRTGEGKVVYH